MERAAPPYMRIISPVSPLGVSPSLSSSSVYSSSDAASVSAPLHVASWHSLICYLLLWGVCYLALPIISYLLCLYLRHSYSYSLFPWHVGFVEPVVWVQGLGH